ncbi:hypothetical protein [Lactococcus allomyrinae]|uniref:Uncharacterized protein n=1 Tax=Lactococcus allomyrinae TaxID=2419773 RepID=A0A387BLZ6_9LACT|nr:hypothetical protein [Lactococcus allomyrinae]AYG02030.1 hypothetical protein D7I46_12900 [Lactococcus allomyrinae]
MMEIKVRTLTNEQVKNLDQIASENKISRDKLISKIVGESLDGTNFLAAHRTFFKSEVAKIIPQLEKNNQVMERALKFLDKEQTHGD